MNDRIESALAELPEATPGPWNQIRPRGSNGFYYVDHRLRAEVARIKTIIADCDGPKEVNKNGL